ncbi:Auxin-responsive protein SAUR32-like [Heracleum sosnowskyi]|uniref:Auxin-responsive protein SAUR32-like n=1 Tax=Heracleum sosnowskyi TaxID=360622 RepID=A0AAD8JGN0_9APIA|nr:Auxin-responsive protein SAUR32-like [Heracleum sosnowskyi]
MVFMIQKKSLRYSDHSEMKCKKMSFFVRIKHALRQLHRRIYNIVSEDNIGNSLIELNETKGNLMDGYFSVLAKGNQGMRKFQVALYYLHHPPFVKLLEAAAQEFGFDQPGVLVIPCEASELEKILTRQSLRPKLNNSVCASH